MSWDKKKPGCKLRYYYRWTRIDGRLVKQYLGRGPAAELAAGLDERERQRRQTERMAQQLDQVQVAQADQALRELRILTDLLVRATLYGAGCYLHHGEWRRRLNGTDSRKGSKDSHGQEPTRYDSSELPS